MVNRHPRLCLDYPARQRAGHSQLDLTVGGRHAIDFQHGLNVGGGRYIPPAKGEPLFGIAPSVANVGLTITGSVSDTVGSMYFTLWHDNRIVVPVLGSPDNLERITLSADLKTGIVWGKVGALGYNNFICRCKPDEHLCVTTRLESWHRQRENTAHEPPPRRR